MMCGDHAVSSGHALDLAASTAALCLLVSRLQGAHWLQRLQISMLTAIEEGGGGLAQQHTAERHAQLEMRVLRALKEAMQYSSLRYVATIRPMRCVPDTPELTNHCSTSQLQPVACLMPHCGHAGSFR